MSLDLEWSDEQLFQAALDKRKVLSIAKRLAKLSQEMQEMGLSVYAANGYGHLVHSSVATHVDGGSVSPECIVAMLGRGFDGGDW